MAISLRNFFRPPDLGLPDALGDGGDVQLGAP